MLNIINLSIGIYLFFVSGLKFVSANELYEGPVGDKWETISELVIPAEGVSLREDTVLNVDRLILKGDITTLGYRLKVNAREVVFKNNAQIIGFKEAAEDQNNIPASYISSANHGKHATDNNTHGADGGNGKTGRKGFSGNPGRQDSKEVNVFALNYKLDASSTGKIAINGNGQQGGKGGTGGEGQDGGRGGDGKDAWARAYCTRGDKGQNGTNGGNGGYAGKPGIGGIGGVGGNNIPIILYSGLSVGDEFLDIQNKVGEGGDPGAAGKWGKSGGKGMGGSSARDEVSCGALISLWKDRHFQSGGVNGSTQKYSTEEINKTDLKAKGKKGPSYNKELAPKKIISFQNLRKRQLDVYNKAYGFHYARLFQFLMQDAIRIATQSQYTRSLLNEVDTEIMQSLLDSDELVIDKIVYAWENYFIQRLKETQVSFNQQEYLDLAQKLVSELKAIKSPLIKTEDKILNWSEKLHSVTDKTTFELLTLNQSCTLFLKEKKKTFNGELPFTDFFMIPACSSDAMRGLVKNPASLIKLTSKRSDDYIFPKTALDLKVAILQNSLAGADRTPQNSDPFQVIIVNNKRFSLADFKNVKSLDESEYKEMALIDSLHSFKEVSVNLQNYAKHVQILLNGLKP